MKMALVSYNNKAAGISCMRIAEARKLHRTLACSLKQ